MKVCIVGGVAGGATVAARLRRRDENAEIIIFERGAYVSYANCGLPYYLGRTIKKRGKLFLQTPQRFRERLNVDVRVESEVLSIDREAKSIRIRGVRDGATYEESYDKLVLSPGAEPIRPRIEGIDLPGIHTLKDVPDADAIDALLCDAATKRAVVVGAGFIGLEAAENLHRRGVSVSIVEAERQVMNVLDFEMAAQIHRHLKHHRIELYLNDAVSSFAADGSRVSVNLAAGRVLAADLVLLSIGVRPENDLAVNAGLSVGERGGIVVDGHLNTSDPDIYAVGDAIEFPHPISGASVTIPLAWPANFQGRLVADNIVDGNTKSYRGTFGTAIAKVFDMTVGSTGLSEKQAERLGIRYRTAVVHSSSHAEYYPGATPLTVKIVFDPEDGRLLGAQAVGFDGVDKRIDMLSAHLVAGRRAYDLAALEHAYAPPYSSAKDAVNIAGYIAENIVAGLSVHVSWRELRDMDPKNRYLLDVRTREEYEEGTIRGAVNIPVDELRGRLAEIPTDRRIVVFCLVGQRAYFAERILRNSGFDDVMNLSGGYATWSLVTGERRDEDDF